MPVVICVWVLGDSLDRLQLQEWGEWTYVRNPSLH